VQDGIPFFPESASTFSGQVDALYGYLILVSAFFSLLISGLITYLALRYRRTEENRLATQIEGVLRLELTWIVIPFALTMVMFGWGAKVFFDVNRMPDDAIDVYVTGKQWMWKLQHPQGQREINELHVPVGQKVRLIMTSEDVIHSFYVPAFRMKRDVVPGRYSLEVSSPGLDRPLRTEAHFRRYVGHEARISLARPTDGRRRFKGEIVSAADGSVTVEVDGARYDLPVADVESAQLVPDWDGLFSGPPTTGAKKPHGRGGNARKRARV